MKMRQRRRRAEGARQPWPYAAADQPLIKEAIGREAVESSLPQIERGRCHQRREEGLHLLQSAIVRKLFTDMIEPGIDADLRLDAGCFDHVARPAPHRVLSRQSYV